MPTESTMQSEKATRRLNLVAEGQHHRPFLEVGDVQLQVSRATVPENAFAYGYDLPGAEMLQAPCPCASVVV